MKPQNALHDLINGLLALMDAFNQPGSRSDFVLDVIFGFPGDFFALADGALIKGIDAKLGHSVIIEHNHKIVFQFIDVNVRINVLRCFLAKLPAGFGFEFLDDIDRRNDFIHAYF